MRTEYPLLLLALVLFPTIVVAKPPNIVVILADDLGWSDLGCHGHPWHESPNIDRLAAAGVRFTDAYAPAPICSASRASLLTGRTPARLGFEFVTKNAPGRQKIVPEPPLQAPPFTLDLPLAERTIAERLGDAGYRTAFFGKWHLNRHHGRYLGWSPTHGPRAQGFDVAVDDFGSHPYGGDREPITDVGRFPDDALVDRAVDLVKGEHDRPFFLLLSHYHVHTPVRSPCAWLKQRYAKSIPMDAPNRDERIEYAAFLATLDHLVGRLLTALDEAGHRDDTLVVFTSDNGGHPEYTSHRPLRGSKWNLYEGGIRVPMIVRWPGHVPPKSVSHTPVVGHDLLPTFSAVAGRPLDPAREKLDGRNLVPILEHPETPLDRPLFWHFPYYHPEGTKYRDASPTIGVDDFAVSRTHPHSAIRRGRFKLLHFPEDDRVELYDLTADAGEQRDLSRDDPGRADRMRRVLLEYLDHVDARRATANEE